jgi:hypothetical protein
MPDLFMGGFQIVAVRRGQPVTANNEKRQELTRIRVLPDVFTLAEKLGEVLLSNSMSCSDHL